MTDYGYFLSCEEFGPDDLLEQARMAEQAGFTALCISDHYHPYVVENARIYTVPNDPVPIDISGFGPRATELVARRARAGAARPTPLRAGVRAGHRGDGGRFGAVRR
jgi:hypothetical protein